MTSIQRIKGANGVIIDSNAYLELPKAPTKTTADSIRNGMIRYNQAWKSFEGVIDFDDGSVAYRRFAQLDSNGRLLMSQLPDNITSGLKYTGTYNPIQDDIDPPYTLSPLPTPSTTTASQYYIVRGIQDAAATHLAANPTSSAFVIFTAPNSAGQWMQIKYYIGKDPSTGSNTIITYAFARFIIASIPSTGHVGMLSLANGNTELTAAFTNTNNPSIETGLSDSDWVILTSTAAQRLRQSRVSILAASVAYDTTILQSVKRQFVDNNSTAQGALDNLAIYGLRRTGDSMTNDGTQGAGRLGITYGTVTAPAIAFNDGSGDPDLNSGMVPSEWTDTSTGIFRPSAGSIGFSSTGLEKFRIENTRVIIYQSGTLVGSNPSLQFNSTTNTNNVGISGINNTLSFSLLNAEQVKFANQLSTFNGSIVVTQNSTVNGNSSVIGNSTIGGNETVTGNLTINGNTILGDAAADTLTVNAISTFAANTVFNGTSNRLKNVNIMPAGILTFEHATTPTAISQATGLLRFDMSTFSDVTIYDGTTERTKFNRYGIKLPVLNPINNAVGEDGMIAFSTERNSVVQKANGTWTSVGSGGGIATTFTVANWVLNGSNYTYTISNPNIQMIHVQELNGTTYTQVEVDTISITATNAVLSIPATPDVRFAGRVIVQYQ